MANSKSHGTNPWFIFDISRAGHRRYYFLVFKKLLGGRVYWGRPGFSLKSMFAAPKLLCMTIDDYFLWFTWVAVIRAIAGKPSVGISIKIENLFAGWTAKRMLKAGLLLIMKRFPKIRVLTTMPYSMEPRLSRYTADWIYDPQFWDIPYLYSKDFISSNAAKIHKILGEKAQGRRVILSPGRQSWMKGAKYFMEFAAHADVRREFLMAMVGPNADVEQADIEAFRKAGGLYLEESLTDRDIVSLYRLVDGIWSCYHPTYNQSSGIFGRALQLGRSVIVRKGSLIEAWESPGAEVIAIPWGNVEEAGRSLRAAVWAHGRGDQTGAAVNVEMKNQVLAALQG